MTVEEDRFAAEEVDTPEAEPLGNPGPFLRLDFGVSELFRSHLALDEKSRLVGISDQPQQGQ
jgi:hypothetical protein